MHCAGDLRAFSISSCLLMHERDLRQERLNASVRDMGRVHSVHGRRCRDHFEHWQVCTSDYKEALNGKHHNISRHVLPVNRVDETWGACTVNTGDHFEVVVARGCHQRPVPEIPCKSDFGQI